MISGFHHFGLSCSDADRSIAFYRDVFGMALVADRQVEKGGFVADVTGIAGARVRIVHLSGYGVNLELLQFSEPAGDLRPRELNHTGSAHTCFVTEDLEAECARLVALGVKVRSKDARPVPVVGGPNDGGKGLYVEDPDGIPIEIIELARPLAWCGVSQRRPGRIVVRHRTTMLAARPDGRDPEEVAASLTRFELRKGAA